MKQTLILTSLILTLSSPALLFAATLQEGSIIPLETTETISTENSHEGDIVNFKVQENITEPQTQTLLIKAGSNATGMVSAVESPRRGMKPGKIKIELMYTASVSGEKIPLRGYVSKEGKLSKAESMICPSLICASTKGKHAFIYPGETYKAFLAKDVTVEK